MGDAFQPNAEITALEKVLQHAYAVTNIVIRVKPLDGTTVTYQSWVRLFKNHARAYKVTNHIDGTAPPAEDDATYTLWCDIDALVLQWIYSTLGPKVLPRVLKDDMTARKSWLKLQEIYLNNKGSRAAALEQEFTTLTLAGCSSMDDYLEKLQELADQLGDCDRPVDENRLVLQLVRGLPKEYDTVASFINQSSPNWDTARNMVQLELHRLNARDNTNPNPTQAVLNVHNNQPQNHAPPTHQNPPTVSPQNPQNPNILPPNPYPNGNQYLNPPQNRFYDNNRNNFRGRNNNRRNSYRGGRGSRNNNNTRPPSGYSPTPPWGWWNAPPCPYPTATNQWPTMPPPQYPSANYTSGAYSPFNALNPSNIVAAYQGNQMQTPDQTWIMDSGASNHVTPNPGSQDWRAPFPPQ